jgi:type IV secretory pathway TraG/TraD family ATPase VirD4
MVDVALSFYFMIPAGETNLTNPDEVQEAIRGLKVFKAPGCNGIRNKAVKYLSKQAVSVLVQIFNAVLSHPSLFLGMEASWYAIHPKPGKDPAQSSTYRSSRLLETIG